MSKKNIIAIPHWLCGTLEHNELKLADLANYDKLRKILSIEDLSLIVALQDKLNTFKLFEEANVSGFLTYAWSESTTNQNEIYDVIYPLSKSKAVVEELNDRLSEHYCVDKNRLYTVVDCERELAAFVVYAGFFDALSRERFQYGIYKRLLKLFYVYFNGSKSFEHNLYGGYLQLLSRLSKT